MWSLSSNSEISILTRNLTAPIRRLPPPSATGVSTRPSHMVKLSSSRTRLVLPTLEPPSSSSPLVSDVLLTICCAQTNVTHADAFDRYKSVTGGVPDNSTGLLKITPTQYKNLRPLDFTTGGRTFSLNANAQIWSRSLNTFTNGTSKGIYLIVNDIGTPSGKGVEFINGYSFLERFFYSSDGSVGLATTPYTTATTN